MLTCKVPWVSITLAGNGNIKPCCVYKGGSLSIHKGDTIDSAWNDLNDLRAKFIAGEKPAECVQCWKREETLGQSRRTWYDDKIQNWPETYELNPDMRLRHMDLNFGNTCNLKCRMCGTWGSTAWYKEESKLSKIEKNRFRRARDYAPPTIIPASYWADKKEMFKYLERIDFKGGEPMMQDGMYDFLEYLVEWGYSKNIMIAYTTNGTKTPERLKTLWPKFKKVKLTISIEGTGKLYEYIRGGEIQTQEQLLENIHWFDQFDNISGSFNSAIQIYNIFDLNNILEFMRDTVNASDKWHNDPDTFKFDCMVTEPKYLDITIMPNVLKQKAIDIIDEKNYKSLNVIKNSLLNSNYNDSEWKNFIDYTKILDNMRNTSIKDVVPQLESYF